MGLTMPLSTDKADDAQRAELIRAWLRIMGVDHAPELDLGTLAMIAEFVEAGRAPCAAADEILIRVPSTSLAQVLRA